MFTWAEHEDVINVNENTIQACKYRIHQPLKSLSGVPESKRDSDKFKQSKRSDDGGLLDVFLSNGNLMIATLEVDLGEYLASFQQG